MNSHRANRSRGTTKAHILSQAHPEKSLAERVTQGQLEAVAMRCQEEIQASLRRTSSHATATLKENVLTIRVWHTLAAAEHNLMRRAAGRDFFQHYIEQLAEQIYPLLTRHVQQILPCAVAYTRATVDNETDSLIFVFGLRLLPPWANANQMNSTHD